MLILRLPSMIISLMLFFGANVNILVLNMAFNVTHLQGFCNAVVFFLSPRVKIGLKLMCTRETGSNDSILQKSFEKEVPGNEGVRVTGSTASKNLAQTSSMVSLDESLGSVQRTNSQFELSPAHRRG